MTFAEALILLKQGKKVRRKGWLLVNNHTDKEWLTIRPRELRQIDDIAIWIFSSKRQYKPWFPYHTDEDATDWEVLEKDPPKETPVPWSYERSYKMAMLIKNRKPYLMEI